MAFAAMIAIGWGVGVAFALLSHPVIYHAVFGGREGSADHERDLN